MAQHWEAGGGFVETVKAVFTEPVDFFKRTPKQGALGRPLLYGVIVGSAATAVGSLWQMLLIWAVAGTGEAAARVGSSIIVNLIFIVLAPLFVVVGLFISTAILHVCLMIVGGAKHGMDATLRVVSYAQTPLLLAVVPVCGNLVGFIWWLVLMVIGLRELHETTTGKAIFAVLLPIFVCCSLTFVALWSLTRMFAAALESQMFAAALG